jgi:thiol-disulfide isomerase/thioredoxin
MNSQQRRAARSTRNQPPPRRFPWVAVVAGLVVIGALVIVVATRKSSEGKGPTPGVASTAVVSKVTSLPTSLIGSVGVGTANLPKAITAPALTKDGKPLVVYFGAEYCPFCAAERWGMVIALSRFGTFTNLGSTHSSSTDVYPSTQTFSFHGATYTSTYLAFEGIELQGNELSGGKYPTLDTPTAEQEVLITTYDAPPYVASASTGSIPFIDLGGRYLVSGASYNPGVLAGKTLDEIATALADPSSAISKGAVGTANALTAAICGITGDQPAAVCTDPAIVAIRRQLG